MSDFFDDDNYEDGFTEDSFEEGVDLGLWRQLMAYTLHYPVEVTILAVCAICTAIAEVAFPLITRAVIDAVSNEGAEVNLLQYGLLYFAFVVLLACSVGGFIWFGGKIRTHVSHDIRKNGFQNLQQLSFAYFDFRPVGWLMARMTSDCERLSNILAWGLLDLIWGSTMMLGIAIAMLYMDISLALIVLSVLPVLAWMSINFQRRILKSARRVRKTNSRITGSFNESIMGVRTSKAFVKEAENLNTFGKLTDEMFEASVLNQVQAALYLPLVLTLGSLATGLALVFGGVEVIVGGVTTGTLIAFLTYTRHFFEPIEELAHWFAEMQMAQASAERIISLIDAESDIQDSPEVITKMALQHPIGSAPDGHGEDIQQIELENVRFSYAVGGEVLKGINLSISKGENIAIVGSTGSGKTSLVNLLCRFYEPTAGRILIDGIDYRARSLAWLQSNLGIVLQSSHIFGGSIADNIRYGRLDATHDEIVAAAKKAGAHGFISRIDGDYDSEVGKAGARLSAGEKQLISFARAILADPAILVMDEATSSIDTVTEQEIQRGLNELLQGRISLVIAHRLSTIRQADRILVLEHGEIIESGDHAALMAQRGRYYFLYSQQHLDEFSREQSNWSHEETINP
jgi:ATP-binding cassette subfamily B protein|tara:strand:- start:3744 stop:5630 length:1887 start_codon:yes stop_codon:yes gene_type:complete